MVPVDSFVTHGNPRPAKAHGPTIAGMGAKARRKKQRRRRRRHRAVKMSLEMYQGLAGQLEALQPDADTSKVISEEVIHRELISAAVKPESIQKLSTL
jgi:hypothetical protein